MKKNVREKPKRNLTNTTASSYTGQSYKRSAQPGSSQNRSAPPASPASPRRATKFIVAEHTELMKFLLDQLSNKGRNKVKSLLTHRQVSVDDNVVTQYNHPLAPGQTVEVTWDKVEEPFQLEGLRILFEDQHVIVIDKPAGLLTVATEDEKHLTAYRQLMDHVRQTGPKNHVFVVHRLDRDTSGVMVFAKSEYVQQQMQNTWREAVLERTYVALVEGRVQKERGTITSWLKETSTMKIYSSRTPNGGQKAITHYKVIQAGIEYSLLEVRLETGRKNQIRVHMEDIGHSIVGDKKYGASKNPIGRLGLHAQVLAFRHPVTKETMRFETEIPRKFRSVFRESSTASSSDQA